jgi:hypothetical protein
VRKTEAKIAALAALRDAVLAAFEQNNQLIAEARKLIQECVSEEADSAFD